MKVEHALRLLPNVEGFLPLRTLLLSNALSGHSMPGGIAPHLTVGKYEVLADDVRAKMVPAVEQITGHFTVLYDAYVHALECVERGAPADAVDDLIRAGETEERGGRVSQAREWYEVALELAEGLRNRRPECAALLALGRLNMATGNTEEAARFYQRGLALADVDGDPGAEIVACTGLGDVGLVRGLRPDAQNWYRRALGHAEAEGDVSHIGLLRLTLGKLLSTDGELNAASEELQRARACFDQLGAIDNIIRTLCAQAEVARDLDRPAESAIAYREALAWAYRMNDERSLEIQVHIGLARLYLHTRRWLEAEEEIRRAERMAIAAGHIEWLVEIYTFLGTLSGLKNDDTGFVFFEQALQFSRMAQGSPVQEARVYVEYGDFKYRMNQVVESRAYLERAQALLTFVGATGEASVVEAELKLLGTG